MQITIVPSDHRVDVDGELRVIDMAGVDPTLHALKFDTVVGKGRAWHKDANGDCWQADVLDFTPHQVFMDRWTAAAPSPPPPPPPPVDASDLANLQKEVKALALCVAQVGGLTVAQMKTLFKQKWDSSEGTTRC